MLHYRVPEGHLAIPGHGDFAFMPDGKDRRSRYLLSCVIHFPPQIFTAERAETAEKYLKSGIEYRKYILGRQSLSPPFAFNPVDFLARLHLGL
jgi:hypothetical protein